MPGDWSEQELGRLGAAEELEIATPRRDGTQRHWTPIWVVRVGDDVYVRTWHGRDTGWFGDAVRSGTGRIRVPGLEADVAIDQVGGGPDGLRADIDAAFRAKYERHGGGSIDQMLTDDAAEATLRFTPVPAAGD